jgi:hypothetical protein
MTDNHVWVGPTKAEEGMHPDLEWLARNVSEWNPNKCYTDELGLSLAFCSKVTGSIQAHYCHPNSTWSNDKGTPTFSETQWLQARKDLGLIMSDEEMEMPAEEWAGSVTEGMHVFHHGHKVSPKWFGAVFDDDTTPTSIKQLRYQDAKGEAWINRERLAQVKVDNRIWDLENKLMEMRCEYES